MNYVFYQTKTHFENTGDVLINKTLIELLRKYSNVICNTSEDIPKEFINELGIDEKEKLNTKNKFGFAFEIIKKSFSSIFSHDKVFIVSGLGHRWGGNTKNAIKDYITGIVFLILKIFRIKIIKIGMSIGPIPKKIEKSEKFRSLFIDYYYVRDTKSLELCQRIGIKKSKLCPDLSWAFESKRVKKMNDNNVVVITFRESTLSKKDDVYKTELLKKIKESLKLISEELKAELSIVIMYQVEEDKNVCKEIFNELNEIYNCKFVDKRVNLQETEKYYSSAMITLSNRLHSLLLSYKYGSLPIAIINKKEHIKISQTFIDNNLEELIIDLYENKNDIKNIIKNRESLYSKILCIEEKKTAEINNVIENIICE